MSEHKYKNSKTYKLFGFIPVYGWKSKDDKKVWKIFGISVLKCRKKPAGDVIKYYILGIPVMKIKRKFLTK